MAKFKKRDKAQKRLLPVSLEEQLIPGTLEFAIHTLVETRMDLSIFIDNYNNDNTGRKAYNPKILLKAVLLAYSRGIISSRNIERACNENVAFMAMTCCQYPDHSTIAAFVSKAKDKILPLFRDVLLVCDQSDLLGGTFFAQDGCKLPSNASREYSGTFSDLKKKQKKIEKKIKQLIDEQITIDMVDKGIKTNSRDKSHHDKQIKRLQQKADRIDNFLKHNDKKLGKRGKEIQSNVTDNESSTMATSHGTIQGYNAQALVDSKHQIIVAGAASGKGQDYDHVAPVIDEAKENIKAIGHSEKYFENTTYTADTSYYSETNLKKCEDEKLNAFIPDQQFRKRDPRFKTQKRHKPKKKLNKFTLNDFQYDEKADEYICPNGKILRLRARKHKIGDTVYRKYITDIEDCSKCNLKKQCLKTIKTKAKTLSVPISKVEDSLFHKMINKIDNQLGRKTYSRRLGIVEPVFANIRTQKRLDRFTLRGKVKVNIQWLLYCMVHNIEKISNYGLLKQSCT